MRTIHRLPLAPALLALALLAVACGGGGTPAPFKEPLTSVGNIQLPHEVGRLPVIDLTLADGRVNRLYVPHGSNSALDIIDLKRQRVLGSVPGLAGIAAVALSSDPRIVFTSDAGAVAVVDVDARKVVAAVRIAGSGDAILYDPVLKVVVVSLGSAQKLDVIDEVGRTVVGTVSLPGKPELMDVDPTSGKVYVAIHDKDEVVVVDPSTQVIDPIYRGCDLKAPTGLALDPQQGRLFVADTTGANEVSVIDVVLDRCLGAIDIGHGADEVAFNPHLHHLYTANGGSRNISVIDTVNLKPLGIAGTGPSAGNVAVDPTSDRVYVVIPHSGIIAVFHDP
jgi:DNA-binding beta-propeller fold protein YncE